MILNATNKSIVFWTDGAAAVTEPSFSVDYADIAAGPSYTPGSGEGVATGATPVTAVSAPGASVFRQVKNVNLFNADTGSRVFNVGLLVGSTTYQLYQRTVAPGQTVTWNFESGWAYSGASAGGGGAADAYELPYDSGTDSNSTPATVGDALDAIYTRITALADLIGGGDDSNSLDGGGGVDATSITYDAGDTGDSNSTATSVAAALDDLYSRVRGVLDAIAALSQDDSNSSDGPLTAYDLAYDSGDPGDSNSTATNVGAALDQIFAAITALTNIVGGGDDSNSLDGGGGVDAFSVTYDAGDTGDSNSAAANVGEALDAIFLRVRTLENVVGAGDDSNSSDGPTLASQIFYDSTTDSNSTPTTVQEALDDLYTKATALTLLVGTLSSDDSNSSDGPATAFDLPYDSGDPGDSNSTATNVGAALDEIFSRLAALANLVGGGDDSNSLDGGGGAVDAADVTYNAGDTGDSNSTATSVQGAIDDLYSRFRALTIGATPAPWYETGTWSPVLSGSAGADYTASGSGGWWVRFGNLIYATGYVDWSAINDATGTTRIKGLPFTAQRGAGGVCQYASGVANFDRPPLLVLDAGNAYAEVFTMQNGSGAGGIGADDNAADGFLGFNFTYMTSGQVEPTVSGTAATITYDGEGDSNSAYDTVKGALDDLYRKYIALLDLVGGGDDSNSLDGGAGDATGITYNSGTDSNSTPTTVQEALDDIYTRLIALTNLVGGGDDSNSLDGGSGGGSTDYNQPFNNLGVAASATAGALTLSVKDAAGADPAAGSVTFNFRSATLATGTPVARSLSAAHSLIIRDGNTLGVPAINTAFALWLVEFDDGGTLRLAVINCLDSDNNVYPLQGSKIASATILTGADSNSNFDSAHTFYADATITSKPLVILARLEWTDGLTALGTWVAPTRIDLADGQLALPGAVVQTRHKKFTAQTLSTSSETPAASTQELTITLNSKANVVEYDATTIYELNSSTAMLAMYCDGANIEATSGFSAVEVNSRGTMPFSGTHRPNSASSVSFKVYGRIYSGATLTLNSQVNWNAISRSRLREIQT